MPSKKNTSSIHRRELTLTERTEIIRENQRGVRTGLIAQRYGCSKQQVRRVIRRKQDYLSLWAKSTNDEVDLVRRLRNPLHVATGRIIYEWILRARHYMDVTDDKIRQAGHQIAAHIDYKDFKSNNKWLSRLKDKYKLHSLKLTDFHTGSFEPECMKPLDIADIITTIKRDDPISLSEYFKMLEGVGNPMQILEGPKKHDDSDGKIKQQETDHDESNYGQITNDDDSWSPYDQGIGMDDTVESLLVPQGHQLQGITTYSEAMKLLTPLEDFALIRENIRAVGLLNQLENLFKDEMAKGNE